MTKRTGSLTDLLTRKKIADFVETVEAGEVPSPEQLHMACRILEEHSEFLLSLSPPKSVATKNKRWNVFKRIEELRADEGVSRDDAIIRACAELGESPDKFRGHYENGRHSKERRSARSALRNERWFTERLAGAQRLAQRIGEASARTAELHERLLAQEREEEPPK